MEKYSPEWIELIARSVVGQLSGEERDCLEEWLKDPRHREEYERICDRRLIYDKSLFYDRHRPDKNWTQFQRRLHKRCYPVWLKYAAIFLLPLVLSCFVYISRHLKIGQDEMANTEHVLPKGSEAVFYFTDGRRVLLNKDTVFRTERGEVLKNEGGALSYEPEGKRKAGDSLLYQVKTPRGGEYEMLLPDGSRVWLNAESSLRFPVAFAVDCRKVYAEGELYFQVAADVSRPFIVVSGRSEVKVLGTEFNIRNYPGMPYAATLVEGSVTLSCENGEVKLKPGQQAVLDPVTGKLAVSEVDVMPYVSWKNGFFYFDNKCLEEIMEELARWYDITVFYEDQAVRQERFTMELPRHGSFVNIVELLKRTGTVHFSVNKRTIVVSYRAK